MQVIYDVINMHDEFQVTSVCHSFTINEWKNIALSGIRTRVYWLTGEDSTTEPPHLHSMQACESYLNIITEILYTLKLICLC